MQIFLLTSLFKTPMNSLHLVRLSDLLQPAYYMSMSCFLRIQAIYGTAELRETNFKEIFKF